LLTFTCLSPTGHARPSERHAPASANTTAYSTGRVILSEAACVRSWNGACRFAAWPWYIGRSLHDATVQPSLIITARRREDASAHAFHLIGTSRILSSALPSCLRRCPYTSSNARLYAFTPSLPAPSDLSAEYAVHVINPSPLPPPLPAPYSHKHHAFVLIHATGYSVYV